SIGADQHGDHDVLNNLTEVRSFDRTDQTDRTIPPASRLELQMEPRLDDRTDRTRAHLPRPTRHSKTHSRARLSLDPLDRGYIKSHSASLDDLFNPSQFQKCHCLLGSYPTPRMFGLLKKSKPQQDVYFPFKTVLEKEQMIFGNKKQFASNGFDFVQKQRNQRKRQNRFDDDEKWVRSGDRPFTKAKRSNRDVFDQNDLQTYVSLEKMLHKAIHSIRQLKKKGYTNTSPAPKQQSNFSSLSNSDLKTNVLSSDKSKAVKPTSKAHSTMCFKCHRIGHYANKCQKKRPLVTLENENVETEPEKEDSLPIFDDFTYEPMEGLDEEQICGHQPNQEKSSSIQKTDQTQGDYCADYGSFAYNPFPFNFSYLRRNLFEEGGNDVPWFVDQFIGADQHGDQDVMNNLTEVRSFDCTDQTDRAVPCASPLELRMEPRPDDQTDRTRARFPRPTRHSKTHSRARFRLDREKTEDGHAFSSGGPSGQSRKRPYLYPVHPSGSDEPEYYLKGHL
uniref:CCHC-type domain-containing protein n=1 Tax=Brassica oleracea var. oleracea TaxID=109376 RepID=A0A0D3D3D7_BRAOL